MKALKYGDHDREISPEEEVGFLMLARVWQYFVVDHKAQAK